METPPSGTFLWPELVASLLALFGLVLSILAGFHPRIWQASGSDFKTLYAAAACFRTHLDPFSLTNIASIFADNRVVPPVSWYAHAPVYPPFTLACIAPLTHVPMVAAVYVWLALSGLLLALACHALVRLAAEHFYLPRLWCFLLIAFFASAPLFSFGLEMGNVSAVVAALSLLTVAYAVRHPWLASGSLAFALLLKPHMAVWALLALLLMRVRSDRAVALRSLWLAAVACIGVAVWMAAHAQLLPELDSYRRMVASETVSGSMDPSRHELIAVAGQITSLSSLLHYGLHGVLATGIEAVVLVGCGAWLLRLCLRDSRYEQPGSHEADRLLRLAAWSGFGLLVTYHRAHDAGFLFILLPLIFARLARRLADPVAWAVLALTFLMGLGPRWETLQALALRPGLAHLAPFLLFRQAPLAAFILFALLLAVLSQRARERTSTDPGTRARYARPGEARLSAGVVCSQESS